MERIHTSRENPDSSSLWLDASMLLHSMYNPEFYEPWDFPDTSTVRMLLDFYLQRIDPRSQDFQSDHRMSESEHSSEYNRIMRVFWQMFSARISNMDAEIQSIQILQAGICTVVYTDGSRTVINLIDEWNRIAKQYDKRVSIHQQTHTSLDVMKDTIDADTLLEGSVILSYAPVAVLWTAALYNATRLVSGKETRSGETEWLIRSVQVRNPSTGIVQEVPLEKLYTGTKQTIRENLFRILDTAGYEYSPKLRGWTHPVQQFLDDIYADAKQLSYKRFQERFPQDAKWISEQAFEKNRRALLEVMERTPALPHAGWSKMQMLLHWIKANPAEGIFFPLSFHHFSRHQNSFTFLQGIGDVTSFYTAYFGSQVALGRIGSASAFSRAVQMGKKIPAAGPIKAIVPLVAGAVAAAATEIGFQTLSAQRAKWKYLSGNKVGSLYTDGTTYEGQALNMLVPETLDMVNRVGSWLAKKTGIPSDDIDIGIPEISLKTPFGYLGTIPEITLFESTVNMGTNPWEWVRWASGRNIDQWNEQVEKYHVRVERELLRLVREWNEDDQRFTSAGQLKKFWDRRGIFAARLDAILAEWRDGEAFSAQKKRLINMLLEILPENAHEKIALSDIEKMRFIVANLINTIRIDTTTINQSTAALSLISARLFAEARSLSSEKKIQQFIQSIPDRMIRGEPLVQNSDEQAWYHRLLDDETPIVSRDAWISIPRWTLFVQYLDSALEYKREKEFFREIQQGNTQGVQWKSVFF